MPQPPVDQLADQSVLRTPPKESAADETVLKRKTFVTPLDADVSVKKPRMNPEDLSDSDKKPAAKIINPYLTQTKMGGKVLKKPATRKVHSKSKITNKQDLSVPLIKKNCG